MTQPQKASKSLEDTLADALKTTKELDLSNSVRSAVQTLLLMRGGINPQLFKGRKKFNPYPALVKYIRASNAETLGGLADEVLRAISPDFVTLRSLGELAEAIYCPNEDDNTALELLQEETTPLVMLMKKIYQDARGGIDEADESQLDGANQGETLQHDPK